MKQLFAILAVAALSASAFAQTTATIWKNSGAPSNGTSEIDTLTIQASTSAGTFTLKVDGVETVPITWTATDATLVARIDTALENIGIIGASGVTTAAGTLSSGIGTVTITFTGVNAKRDMPAITIGTNSLTGGTAPTITTTTAGAEATFRLASTGQMVVDSTTGAYYRNTSTTSNAPTWTPIQQVVSATNALGYATGAGGAVTQITSSATGVTLNSPSGAITTVALTTAAAAEEEFTVTNSQVAAGDVVVLSTTYAGTGTPILTARTVAAGSFKIVISNVHASAAFNAVMVINYAVIKAAGA